MSELFIPTLHTFAMNNIFTGSQGLFRFRAAPQIVMLTPKEVNMEESSIVAASRHGPLAYEKSPKEGREGFPLTPHGREDMKAWLEAHIAE